MTIHNPALKKVAVVFFSNAGTTAQIAQEIAAGAAEIERVEALALRIDSDHIHQGRFRNEVLLKQLDHADAVVMGSPTYMGGPAAQFKSFADSSSERWYQQRWKGKLAAGFSVGSYASGDQAHTLNYFSVLAGQHSMLWCGLDLSGVNEKPGLNRLGNEHGLVVEAGSGNVLESDLQTARYFGRQIALTAQRLS